MDCSHDYIYDEDFGKNVCMKCALYSNEMIEEAEFKPFASHITKTIIPYHPKYKHLNRLHTWSNYDYYEVRDANITSDIEDLYFPNVTIKDLTIFIFLQDYKKVRTRGKVKLGLVLLSMYKAYLINNKKFNFDEWFNKLNILPKHLNSASKKASWGFYYPDKLDKYLKQVNFDFNKDEVIFYYTKFIELNSGYNIKNTIHAIMMYIMEKKGLDTGFYNIFSVHLVLQIKLILTKLNLKWESQQYQKMNVLSN